MPEIDLRIRHIDQLFDSLDPAPFHEKALDRNAEAYLLECAGEHRSRQRLTIVLHGPASIAPHVDDIASAIHAHFALMHAGAERRHRHRRRIGRIALATGFAILAIALVLRTWVESLGGPIGEVLAEGLLILAWVAIWRPLETIGFDSWESREFRRTLDNLAHVPVRLVPTDA